MRSGRSENQWMTQGLDLLEQRHVRHCGPEMCDWYKELRAFILGLGYDIEAFTHSSARCTTFRRRMGQKTRAFAWVNCRPSLNRIAIDTYRPSLEAHFDGQFLVPLTGSGFRKNLMQVRVECAEDVELAKPFIEQSYKNS